MNMNPSPVFLQEGKEARMGLLAGFADFGFLRMFKDGSGSIHNPQGEELLRFHDVKHLKAIAENENQRIADYGKEGEDLLGYTYTTFANRKKRVRPGYVTVSQDGTQIDLRLLQYYPGFSTVTLFPDGSGYVSDFNDSIAGRFQGIEDLRRVLVSHAVERRLQGEPKR
jgi:hypothetical protein